MRLTKEAPYIYTKRNIYYFSRRVPEDLKDHYRSSRIVMSLRTKSLRTARTRSAALYAKLEEDWLTLRWRSSNDPFQRFLMSRDTIVIAQSKAPLLSEAQSIYLKAKQKGRPKTFNTAVDRSVRCLVGLHGDKPIDTYSRSEANQLRDAFVEKGLGKASIQRSLNVIRAILNFTTRELGIDEVRAFSGIYLGDDPAIEPKKRLPIPVNTILDIQNACHRLDDEARWLMALISDTGMRLSEAVGLVKDDVILDFHTPHIRLREHPWRRLKTRNSE